jgi:hypothetical protein
MAGRMTDRSRRRLLWLLNALMGAGIVLVVASAMLPVEAGPPAAPPSLLVRPPTTAPAGTGLLGLPAYIAALSRDLQQPLFDKPPAPPPSAGPAAPPPVVLEGTAIDAGGRFAVFRLASGQSQLLAVGQSILGVDLISVTAKSATVRWQGQTLTLQVPAGGGQP